MLTRDDGENLDIVMAAREINPRVRVVMRLYDDDFAATVSRTMRASYPDVTTRSRSVSALAALPFAAAMMGRHVLGIMPVERGPPVHHRRCRRPPGAGGPLHPPGLPAARVARPGRRVRR